jgi:hypothetical protein
VPIVIKRDVDGPPGDFYVNRLTHSRRNSTCSGTTTQGFPDSAFMHPHTDACSIKALYEFHIDTVGKVVGGNTGSYGEAANLCQILDECDGMWIRCVDARGKEIVASVMDVRRGLPDRDHSHINAHCAIRVHPCLTNATSGAKEAILTNEPTRIQKSNEHPSTVSTHLGYGSISISVIHERHTIVITNHPDDTIGTNSAMTITQPTNIIFSDRDFVIKIGDENEVITSAVTLDERDFCQRRHSRSLLG